MSSSGRTLSFDLGDCGSIPHVPTIIESRLIGRTLASEAGNLGSKPSTQTSYAIINKAGGRESDLTSLIN